jgi:hypothetical protein
MVQTRWTRVVGASTRYTARLQIPYAAFPVDATADSYEIEARVTILRTERNRRMTALGTDTTTFRVFSLPEDEQPLDEPTGPVLDRVGASTPTSTGEIVEPGLREGEGPKATPSETGVIEDLPSGTSEVPPGR